MLKINIFSKLNREYLSESTQLSLISYIDCEVMYLYEVKVFIGNKEVKKIDDQQRKAMLEKALSTFHKKDVKVSCAK